jgi:lipoprotein-releasing system ATP-binding protein
MSEPLVAVRGLAKAYQSGGERVEVLCGVEFALEAGSSLAVTGESGSGKSTLLNLVGGLDRADGGSIVVGGEEVSALAEAELSAYRNRRVGFIFQFHFLLRDFTALENVMIPGMLMRQGAAALRRRAAGLLAAVGLERRADAFPLELSGGERQRVAVARALVNSPSLILADEPTGNLDERNARTVEQMLFSLVASERAALLLVTHDLALASLAGSRRRLEGGRLAPA